MFIINRLALYFTAAKQAVVSDLFCTVFTHKKLCTRNAVCFDLAYGGMNLNYDLTHTTDTRLFNNYQMNIQIVKSKVLTPLLHIKHVCAFSIQRSIS